MRRPGSDSPRESSIGGHHHAGRCRASRCCRHHRTRGGQESSRQLMTSHLRPMGAYSHSAHVRSEHPGRSLAHPVWLPGRTTPRSQQLSPRPGAAYSPAAGVINAWRSPDLVSSHSQVAGTPQPYSVLGHADDLSHGRRLLRLRCAESEVVEDAADRHEVREEAHDAHPPAAPSAHQRVRLIHLGISLAQLAEQRRRGALASSSGAGLASPLTCEPRTRFAYTPYNSVRCWPGSGM